MFQRRVLAHFFLQQHQAPLHERGRARIVIDVPPHVREDP